MLGQRVSLLWPQLGLVKALGTKQALCANRWSTAGKGPSEDRAMGHTFFHERQKKMQVQGS